MKPLMTSDEGMIEENNDNYYMAELDMEHFEGFKFKKIQKGIL